MWPRRYPTEMATGVHTALGQMLAEELTLTGNRFRLKKHPRSVNTPAILPKATFFANIDFPNLVILTVDGMMMNVADTLNP